MTDIEKFGWVIWAENRLRALLHVSCNCHVDGATNGLVVVWKSKHGTPERFTLRRCYGGLFDVDPDDLKQLQVLIKLTV